MDSGTLGYGYAGDLLKVGEELDVLEAGDGKQIVDGWGLVVADFEDEEATGD